MRIINGYNLPIAAVPINTNAVYEAVSWGEWQQGQLTMAITVMHWHDGVVRVHARYSNGGECWCERGPVAGDNVLDYVRLAVDDQEFKPGANGYYYSPSVDPDGERGTNRHAEGGAQCQPVMVTWRNSELM